MPQNFLFYFIFYIFNVKAILGLKQLLLMRIFFCKMNDVKMFEDTSQNPIKKKIQIRNLNNFFYLRNMNE